MSNRIGTETRKSRETEIAVELNFDGTGRAVLNVDNGFFGHMLELLAFHGGLDLQVTASGDTHVDDHHLIEDAGICIGRALRTALGDRVGIARYGSALVPMDEALAEVVLDLGGRPYLVFNGEFSREMMGDFSSEMVEEFFRAITVHGGITLHINLRYGKNNHHIAEAIFKGFGQALRRAAARNAALSTVASTKGILD
jgi:imidazoleglycerol-phosphate dehydratase